MAKNYALPSKQRYPLTNAEYVKTAAAYFDEHYRKFGVSDRAEYAYNLMKAAEDFGVKIASSNVINYSNRGYYSPEFEQNMLLRKIACSTKNVRVKTSTGEMVVAEQFEKLASSKDRVAPEQMVYLVHELDKIAGMTSVYDHEIKDAYFTVFGCNSNPDYCLEKKAGENHWLTDKEILDFAEKPGAKDMVMIYFGENFAQDFILDPIETYRNVCNNANREAFHHMVRKEKNEAVIPAA